MVASAESCREAALVRVERHFRFWRGVRHLCSLGPNNAPNRVRVRQIMIDLCTVDHVDSLHPIIAVMRGYSRS